ncbi:MAG: winged helix-turn-helix domain-containing protein [Halobacteriota archaeon]
MMTKTRDGIINLCGTLSNKHRLRIIAALSEKRKHTSELARELELSRPLLCLHLRNLEEVGILIGKTELGIGNRARKYYELRDFELCLNGKKIREVLENEENKKIKPYSAAQSSKLIYVNCRSKEDLLVPLPVDIIPSLIAKATV